MASWQVPHSPTSVKHPSGVRADVSAVHDLAGGIRGRHRVDPAVSPSKYSLGGGERTRTRPCRSDRSSFACGRTAAIRPPLRRVLPPSSSTSPPIPLETRQCPSSLDVVGERGCWRYRQLRRENFSRHGIPPVRRGLRTRAGGYEHPTAFVTRGRSSRVRRLLRARSDLSCIALTRTSLVFIP